MLTVDSDNGGADCEGNSDDDSGETGTLYVVVQSNSLDIYDTATGGTASTFMKQ
jgi:hypothetical protein